MSEDRQPIEIKSIPVREVAEALSQTHPFEGTGFAAFAGTMANVDRVTAQAGAMLIEPAERWRWYWVLLEGKTRAERRESDGSWTLVGYAQPGDGFGEVPLLAGKPLSPFRILADQDSVLIRFTEQDFWSLMSCCPAVRAVVLADMAQRLQAYQVEALHREKLVSLGTLAAGLMHELHNPGSAAKRAASQLRQNMLRLQQLTLRGSDHPKTPTQMECMRTLLEHTVSGCHAPALSTLEEADAEEAMAAWLKAAGVENAFKIAPSLVEIGFKPEDLICAREAFEAKGFSDALNWLEALVSSVSLVCAIEESITRVSELVMAVKKFAYDDRMPGKEVDVHDSLQSTLTVLGHKIRIKNIAVQKQFDAAPAAICTRGASLSQVWTNLIDNAVDASPADAAIEISTWTEPGWLAVSIVDHGAGIPPEVLPHIFEAFYTTKQQGSGTGLGLEIVHRIVTQKFGGTIAVESRPGSTRFLVRLPTDVSAITCTA